jgi:hypothetical protein
MEPPKKINFNKKIVQLYLATNNAYRATKDPRLVLAKWLLVAGVYAEKASLMVFVPALVLMLITKQPFFDIIANATSAAWIAARSSLFMLSYWLPRYLKKIEEKK